MKANRLLGAALAVGFGFAVITGSVNVEAQSKKPKAAATPAVAAEPPIAKKPITLDPSGIAWGMNHKQVAAAIDKWLDQLYKPIYKKTSPGVKMKALDAQLAEEKNAFRRSRINFNNLPTGIDQTPLRGEFSYLNKESMLTLTRDGLKRHFFFIQDKLWKIIDEIELGEKIPQGKDFKDATSKLNTFYGVPGRVLAADPAKGRSATEVDWKDGATHLRAIQRSDEAMALAYEDLITVGSLASLRPNKPSEENAIDPAVADVVRKDEAPPEPPKAGSKTPSKGPKK